VDEAEKGSARKGNANVMRACRSLSLLLLSWVWTFPLFGIGVEAVHVVSDAPGSARHAAQMAEWAKQIEAATTQISRADQLIRQTDRMLAIIGDPSSVIDSVSTISGAVDQMNYIFKSDTTRSLKRMVDGTESLNRASTRFQKTIGNSVIAGGTPRKRNESLYSTYALMERSKDNFDKIVELDKKTQERELKRQRALNVSLAAAQTTSEMDKINAAIAASKAVQDASSQSVMKAKGELDAEKSAIDLENEKQMLAAWEEHQIKEAHKREMTKKTRENYKKHIDNELYSKISHDTKVKIYQ